MVVLLCSCLYMVMLHSSDNLVISNISGSMDFETKVVKIQLFLVSGSGFKSTQFKAHMVDRSRDGSCGRMYPVKDPTCLYMGDARSGD